MRGKLLVVGMVLLLSGIILLDCLTRYSQYLPFAVTAQNDYEFTVSPSTAQPVVQHLNKGDRLKGEFTIAGGERNDIGFRIENPVGNLIVDINRLYDMFCYLDFTANVNGKYLLCFDNTFSESSEKQITLTTKVISTSRLLVITTLAGLLATIGVCVSIAGAIVKPKATITQRARKNSRPLHGLQQMLSWEI